MFFASPRQSIVLQMQNATVTATDDTGAPYDSTATLAMNNNGFVQEQTATNAGGTGPTNKFQYVIPAELDTLVECRVTSVSFDPAHGGWDTSPGADGTWFPISTGAKSWSVNSTSSGTDSTTATMEIRIGSSGSALASATFTWTTTNTIS